jgi:hypothetical protein
MELLLSFGGIMMAGGKPMSNSLLLEPTAEEAMELQTNFKRTMAEMDRLFKLMAHDQEEIDRLAARSQSTLAEIRAVSERTEAILASLRTSWWHEA